MPPIPRPLDYDGPAVLSYGFRPFYLFGALYAGVTVFVWLAELGGGVAIGGVFIGRDWHAHELLFGYVAAAIAGYVLMAVPNWTGKLPMQGGPLLALVLTWLAGRLAVVFGAPLGAVAVLVIDCAFLFLLAFVVGREVVGGRSLRNGGQLAALLVLLAANILFHVEAMVQGAADFGLRLSVAAVVGLIVNVGGRIIPSFTRNWLARCPPGRMTQPFGTFDKICVGVAFAALGLWVALPYTPATGLALVVAGVAHTVRLVRWAGERSWRNPLVLILHIAYAFIPAGFILVALAAYGFAPPSAGIHAWTAGAMGTMTLAVMTRTSLSFTGRPRVAGLATNAVYALVVSGALLRIVSGFGLGGTAVLHLAGLFWALAFFGFAAAYWPALTAPRVNPASGRRAKSIGP